MDRALLTLALLAVCVLLFLAMRRGWRQRARRQSGLAAPVPPPAEPGHDLIPALDGVYVSTTAAGSWQDRIVAHGLGRRTAARVRLTDAGVLIERAGASDLFLPLADIAGVATAPGIAGKVMGVPDGVLVITWTLGGTPLDTGIRADDPVTQADWIDAARLVLAGPRPSDAQPVAGDADPPRTAGGHG